jgi:hypothetical protein
VGVGAVAVGCWLSAVFLHAAVYRFPQLDRLISTLVHLWFTAANIIV